jgi:hypothetical protein
MSKNDGKIAVSVGHSPGTPGKENKIFVIAKMVIFQRTFFHSLNRNLLITSLLAISIVLFGGLLSVQANTEPLLLYYVNASSGSGQAWLLLLFPLGWFATFAISDLLCVTLFHRKGGELSLLVGTAFAMLPLFIVPGTSLAANVLLKDFRPNIFLTLILSIMSQAWIVGLLSGAISVSKGLRIEFASLVSVVVVYLNVLTVLAAFQFGLL